DPPFVIFSDRREAGVWARAERLGVPIHHVPDPDDDRWWNERLDGARLVFLAGYLKKLPAPVVHRHFAVNLHPSLLPKFGGKGMYGLHVHRAVLAAGEKQTGITLHRVSENYDEGPILFQASLPVPEGAAPETLAAAVQELERRIVPQWIWELYHRQA
ncbi:MAG: phosphoribosylglycinamide formyltransferase, partial [Bacteroidia bacterium]|nr:phosphoribosylglycinamide formyltransferase [Bacteroidia bacterium]